MTLVPLDAGVYAWLDDATGSGCTNAGVIIDADAATVVDSLTTLDAATLLNSAVEQLGTRVRRTVLTASTIEFVGGSSAFTMSGMYGRTQTSEHLDQPPTPAIYRRLFPTHAESFDDEMTTRPITHITDGAVQLTPAVALHPFSGPQAQNLVAVVDGAGICFAGAMCSFGVTPRCYQGNAGEWADELDRLLTLAPIFVPGHGPIGGEEEVRVLQGYLRAVVDADGDVAAIATGPWDNWVERENDQVNVERAAMCAAGVDEIPPAMLRLAGIE